MQAQDPAESGGSAETAGAGKEVEEASRQERSTRKLRVLQG